MAIFGLCSPMPRTAPFLNLNTEDHQQIQQWMRALGTPQQVVLRGRIVLAAAQGQSDTAIAQQFRVNRKTVILWRRRFVVQGPESLWEIAPGRGRKPLYGADKVKAIVDATLQTKPKGMTQWSYRLMAKSQGVSKSTVQLITGHITSNKDNDDHSSGGSGSESKPFILPGSAAEPECADKKRAL